MKDTEVIRRLAEHIGSERKLAAELGLSNEAVRQWRIGKKIPRTSREKVRVIAARAGIRLSHEWLWSAS